MEKKKFERLPKNVKPSRYAICLTPNFNDFTFDGEVSIQVDVLESTGLIKLNSNELEIKSAVLKAAEGGDILSKSIKLIEDEEILEIELERAAQPGTCELEIKFKGTLNTQMTGFYKSTFTDENGETKYIAVTHFEPTYARKCYPCWDEPSLKAVFDISVICDPKLAALSNMPIKQTTEVGELVRHDFESSPVMSTYLSALAVGDYGYIEDKTTDGILVRLYAPKHKLERGRTALEVATKVLVFYKDYFNIPYPLPKVDMISLADFEMGAMENWGMITYREVAILIDPGNTSNFMKSWVYTVVAHELAHQWFGNLVTMEWWTHLWLNEGYASFMQFLSLAHIYEEFDFWSDFVFQKFLRALDIDSLKNSHPIEVEVGHPSEVMAIFDAISYAKGCSVLRMIHHYIGDCSFRKGMYIYLTRHKYKNAQTEDLWAALEVGSKKPIKKIMSSWTQQTGYPVITVDSTPHEDGVMLQMDQKRFLLDPKAEPESTLWCVPIFVCTSESNGKEVAGTLFDTETGELFVPSVPANGWVKLNPKLFSFYRVNYSPSMLQNLRQAIEERTLHPLDRMGLLEDLFVLSRAGYCSTVEFLKMARKCKKEDDPNVWRIIVSNLVTLYGMLNGTDCEEDMNEYIKNLLSEYKEQLGWSSKPGESYGISLCRPVVLFALVRANDEMTLREGKDLFLKHIANTVTLEPDVRLPAYVAAVKMGYSIDKMFEMEQNSEAIEEKSRIYSAVAFSKSPAVVKRLLDYMMSDNVRLQDKYIIFYRVANTRNKEASQVTWKFIVDNEESIRKSFEGTSFMESVISSFDIYFTTFEEADMMESYFKEHPYKGVDRCLLQTLETIRNMAEWRKKDYRAIDRYFHQCFCSQREG